MAVYPVSSQMNLLQQSNELARLSIQPGHLDYNAYCRYLHNNGHVIPNQGTAANVVLHDPQNTNLQNNNGDRTDDKTDFRMDQAFWSQHNLPDVIYVFRRPPTWLQNQDLKRAPYKQYDIYGQRVRDVPILPDHVSSQVEGWRIEAWVRFDPRVTFNDILRRMEPDKRHTNKTVIQMRAFRFRNDCNILGWVPRGINHHKRTQDILTDMANTGIDPNRNSTRGLSWGLKNVSLGEAGGRNVVPLSRQIPNTVAMPAFLALPTSAAMASDPSNPTASTLPSQVSASAVPNVSIPNFQSQVSTTTLPSTMPRIFQQQGGSNTGSVRQPFSRNPHQDQAEPTEDEIDFDPYASPYNEWDTPSERGGSIRYGPSPAINNSSATNRTSLRSPYDGQPHPALSASPTPVSNNATAYRRSTLSVLSHPIRGDPIPVSHHSPPIFLNRPIPGQFSIPVPNSIIVSNHDYHHNPYLNPALEPTSPTPHPTIMKFYYDYNHNPVMHQAIPPPPQEVLTHANQPAASNATDAAAAAANTVALHERVTVQYFGTALTLRSHFERERDVLLVQQLRQEWNPAGSPRRRLALQYLLNLAKAKAGRGFVDNCGVHPPVSIVGGRESLDADVIYA